MNETLLLTVFVLCIEPLHYKPQYTGMIFNYLQVIVLLFANFHGRTNWRIFRGGPVWWIFLNPIQYSGVAAVGLVVGRSAAQISFGGDEEGTPPPDNSCSTPFQKVSLKRDPLTNKD
jgi:hypothetical protein